MWSTRRKRRRNAWKRRGISPCPKNPLTSLQFSHTNEQFFFLPFFLSFSFFSLVRSIHNYFSIRYFHFTLLRGNSISPSLSTSERRLQTFPSSHRSFIEFEGPPLVRRTYLTPSLFVYARAYVISARRDFKRSLEIEIGRRSCNLSYRRFSKDCIEMISGWRDLSEDRVVRIGWKRTWAYSERRGGVAEPIFTRLEGLCARLSAFLQRHSTGWGRPINACLTRVISSGHAWNYEWIARATEISPSHLPLSLLSFPFHDPSASRIYPHSAPSYLRAPFIQPASLVRPWNQRDTLPHPRVVGRSSGQFHYYVPQQPPPARTPSILPLPSKWKTNAASARSLIKN